MSRRTGPAIFISIASYLDPMLFFTLNDALAKAIRPELLSLGVVDQHVDDQRAMIAALPFARQVRYVHLHPHDTLGVSWARSTAFSLYDGEAFLLQVDSHTLFEPGWDEQLRSLHAQLTERSAKPVVSTYPLPLRHGGRQAALHPGGRPHRTGAAPASGKEPGAR